MPFLPLHDLHILELCGIAGALIYVGGYLLIAFDVLHSRAPLYYALNLAAALLVLVGLSHSFNLASALIQVFFATASLIGIVRHARRPRRAPAMPVAAP